MPLHHVKELLGHANISQTDTYLNAGRIVLQASIQRFDAFRGKSWQRSNNREPPSLSHEDSDVSSKDLLH
jgi:hypothetical protein